MTCPFCDGPAPNWISCSCPSAQLAHSIGFVQAMQRHHAFEAGLRAAEASLRAVAAHLDDDTNRPSNQTPHAPQPQDSQREAESQETSVDPVKPWSDRAREASQETKAIESEGIRRFVDATLAASKLDHSGRGWMVRQWLKAARVAFLAGEPLPPAPQIKTMRRNKPGGSKPGDGTTS